MAENKLKRINVELSAYCNYSCVGCPNTYMARKKGHMSSEIFQQIFHETGNILDTVYLANFGESLLNQKIHYLLESIRDTSIKKILSTNGGTLYRFDNLEFLGALDELVVSINGFDEKTFAHHQKGGSLQKVKEGLNRVVPIMANAKTDYVLQMVAHKMNLEEINKLEEFAQQFGFKTIVIKSFNVMNKSMDTFKEFVPIGTEYSRYKKEELPSEKTSSKIPCKEWMVINWNGDVNPCCWDYEGKYIMGNVAEQGVFGVWNSPKMMELRENIESGNLLDICNNCGDSQEIKRFKVDK